MPIGSEPWAGGRRLLVGSALCAGVGLAGTVVGLIVAPQAALLAYLVAFASVASLLASLLTLLMMFHAARSVWPTTLRRLVEMALAPMPLLVVLFVPLVVGGASLYPWHEPSLANHALVERLQQLGDWYAPGWFAARGFIYLACWCGLAWALCRWSLKQDEDGDARWLERAWRLSGVGLVALALTLTWASFDWLMSLTPLWHSTIYGVYVFSGGFVAALALTVLLMAATLEGPLRTTLNPAHFHAVGKLLLSMVSFWGYIFFAQFFIVWIADLPEEVSWWLPRMDGWGVVTSALVIGHFALPFCALLSRELKRSPRGLTLVCVWLLVMHVVDVWWLVMPTSEAAPRVPWLLPFTLLLVGGLSVGVAVHKARGRTLVPLRDPRLPRATAYEGT